MKFQKTKLKNGLKVVTVPLKDSTSVTVLIMVETGSKYETKKINGLSHFLEHMCFKGTMKRPKASDISRELDAIGSQYNAFTGQEYTGYYAKAHPKHIGRLLDVVSDLYLNPVFDPIEIEKEKGVIIEEINMYEDMPQRHIYDMFMELLYGDQPAGWNIAGPKDNIRKMERQDFIDYRKDHYVSGATTLLIAGNFDKKKIMPQVMESFNHIKEEQKKGKLKVKEKQGSPNVMVKPKKTDQTHLMVGVRSFDVTDKRIPALKVLNAVLGGGMSSRLFQKLRDEMGVGYYVKSSSDEYTDHGYLAVNTGVDNKRVKEVIEAILAEFRRFKTEEVPEEELKKAKDWLIGNLYLSLESSDALAEFYGGQEVLKHSLETPQNISKEIKAVTSKDILKIAKDIFQNKNLNLALIGSTSKDSLKNILKL